MRHEKRRQELARMLMDIAKYLATVGLIGGFLTNTLTLISGLMITIVVIVLVFTAFYTIPENEEVK